MSPSCLSKIPDLGRSLCSSLANCKWEISVVWGLVGLGTNKPKMLFVLKICYLIQNMWWWPGNWDIKLLQQHCHCSSALLSCDVWVILRGSEFRVLSSQAVLPSLQHDWSEIERGGRRYLSISGNHWKKHAQFWSEQTDVKPQITINKLCFWYFEFLWIISVNLTVFFLPCAG